MFLQTVMPNVPYNAYDLAPRLVVALEAQPVAKSSLNFPAKMNAYKFIVHQNHCPRVSAVCVAQHSPGEKWNAERAAEIFIHEQRERDRPLDRIRRLRLTFKPITFGVVAA